MRQQIRSRLTDAKVAATRTSRTRRLLLALVVAIALGAGVAPAALGADSVYWSGGGAIRVGNLDGSGSPANLFTGEPEPTGVAIDPAADKIYWSNVAGGVIRVGNLDGSGSAANLFTGEADPTGVAIDPAANRIYWANTSGAIRVANLDGTGSPATLFGGGASFPPFPALLRAPQGTGAPFISGLPRLGHRLSCGRGSWAADLEGAQLYRAPRSFAYAWQRNGAAIPGAIGSILTTTHPGHYSCRVTASNEAGSSSQTSNPVTVPKASPSLSSEASADTTLGRPIRDIATLRGGFGPGGRISFRAYGPGDTTCSRAPVFTDTVAVFGNGGYPSAKFRPTKPGLYRWTVAYSGDPDNRVAHGACNAAGESVRVR